MSDSFTDAVDSPITRTIGGKVQVFPRWTLEDAGPWVDEIHAKMVATLAAKMDKKLSQQEKDRYVWNLENDKPEPVVLEVPMLSASGPVSGIRRALRISLAHLDIPVEAADNIIDAFTSQYGVREAQRLARRVSGLFDMPEDAIKANEEAAKARAKADELEKKVTSILSRVDTLESLLKVPPVQAESESTGQSA